MIQTCSSFHVNNNKLSTVTLVYIPVWWHCVVIGWFGDTGTSKNPTASIIIEKWLNSGPVPGKPSCFTLKMNSASFFRSSANQFNTTCHISQEWKQNQIKIAMNVWWLLVQSYFLNTLGNINWRSSEMQFRHNECMCLHHISSPHSFLATVLDVFACCRHLNKLHMIVCVQDQVWDTANHAILVFVQWSMFYILHSTWEKKKLWKLG